MSAKAGAIIEKGVQARLGRDWPSVVRCCRLLRRHSIKSPLTPWEMAHLEMLEFADAKFESGQPQRLHQLRKIGERLTAVERNQSFLFLYEMSGCLIHSRLYGAALEFSLQAESLRPDLSGWLSAHLNSLVCREALGLDITNDLKSVRRKMAKVKRTAVNPKSLVEWELLCLRWNFRQGRFDFIERSRREDLLYYWWLRQLPQVPWTKRAPKFRIRPKFLLSSYGQFDLNTLLFRCSPEDLARPPMNHWCDRLYLWVWTWYLKPDLVPSSHIWWLLEGFEFERHISAMTMEDKIMVYHALRLFSFKGSNVQSALKLLWSRLSPLRYEQFPFLAKELGQLERFEKGPSVRPTSFKNKITVDVTHGRIEGPSRRWSVMSGAMASALGLLLRDHRQQSVSLDVFVREVFRLPVFDSFIHYRKVYNLLVRLKSLERGDFEFKIRTPAIHFRIEPRRYHLLAHELDLDHDYLRWQRLGQRIQHSLGGSLSESLPTDDGGDLKPLFVLRPSCSRGEIMRAKGWNKSKATRQIRRLVKAGILKTQGRGRSIRYTMLSP